ncbi:hypothetical protein [Flavobacterium reichenbachii]|uniref:Uncharacterized protein n=1 Tax=Flavobacterium reichenbachii TaxID=362418 RepID=A0A085ZEN5_9FLAO|nr:hypothetical protein [Flavobacterium reichenbachii]KFF02899.1 hypothetical protein IW19_22335 [Flavobacterium reichenbachii]OXB16891.1 hypothetical protein B0A68_05520 [Flavobacterium reichenbachii]
MALYLLFQIIVSWSIAFCILQLFYKIVSATNNEIYREPTFLTWLLTFFDIDFSLKAKFIASTVINHFMGLCFTAVYYLIWYCEFTEISWTTTLAVGLVTALLRIISWIFLLIIIPSAKVSNFKGYYLQLVFLHNIFTIIVLTLYRLVW